MCVAFWLLEAHPKYKLLLALNRDELFSRPTQPVHHWVDQPHIIGGRDGVEGGTWLAISESGRLAFVTNFRELNPNHEGAVSRGELPTSFLQSSKPPHEYLEEIAARAGDYNGFNLIVADVMAGDMAYLTNRPHDEPIEVKKVSTGLHCLSNANLDSPWPKALWGKEKLEALISQFSEDLIPEEHIIESLLSDSEKADYSHLPETGLPLKTEHVLSPIFVYRDAPPYGTRSMAVVAVLKTGEATFYEKYIEDGVWKDHKLSFTIPTTTKKVETGDKLQSADKSLE